MMNRFQSAIPLAVRNSGGHRGAEPPVEYQFRNLSTIEKQEMWRQTQFQIFYGNGRPIFNINKDTQHLKSHNNPYSYKDLYQETSLFKSIRKKLVKDCDADSTQQLRFR